MRRETVTVVPADAVRLDGVALDARRGGAGGRGVDAVAWGRSDVDVEPQRGQIVHLRVDGVDTSVWPVVVPVGDHYIVPFDDQHDRRLQGTQDAHRPSLGGKVFARAGGTAVLTPAAEIYAASSGA